MYKVIRLYRHGETEWNRLGRLQGWLDSPLTAEGRRLAVQVEWNPAYVVSSDLGRAMETARLMFPGVPVQTDARLREIYLGDWQGQFIAKLGQLGAYQCYLDKPGQFTSSEQESFFTIAMRMQQVIGELQDVTDDQIAIVSHGVAIASFIAYMKEGSFQNIWRYLPRNGQYVELKLNSVRLSDLEIVTEC